MESALEKRAGKGSRGKGRAKGKGKGKGKGKFKSRIKDAFKRKDKPAAKPKAKDNSPYANWPKDTGTDEAGFSYKRSDADQRARYKSDKTSKKKLKQAEREAKRLNKSKPKEKKKEEEKEEINIEAASAASGSGCSQEQVQYDASGQATGTTYVPCDDKDAFSRNDPTYGAGRAGSREFKPTPTPAIGPGVDGAGENPVFAQNISRQNQQGNSPMAKAGKVKNSWKHNFINKKPFS